jgi:type II secretory pathway component PulF
MDNVELSGVASVFAVGAAMALAASIVALSRRGGAAEAVLRYTGHVLMAVGAMGVCFAVVGWLGVIAWPIVMIIWARAAAQYRATQKRNLLAALAVAIGKQMPLAPMVSAFANEQEHGFAVRAQELAKRLEGGAPLGEAIAASRRALPPETALAAAVGLEAGDLTGAVQATTASSAFDRSWLQPTISRLLYLTAAMACFLVLFSFMQVRIMPAWGRILSDFNVGRGANFLDMTDLPDPPLPTALLDWMTFNFPIGFAVTAMVWGTLLAMAVILGAVLVIGYVWLQWRGTLQPRLPGLRRVITWVDMGPVLRILALAVRRDRPLMGMLSAISRLHPKRSVRSRMRRVVRDVGDGMPWQDSLRRRGLINATDEAILASASRTGNLHWALVEMADGFERRANYRLQALSQTIVPLLMVPLGLATAAIAMSYFVPLTLLIRSVSR